MSSLSPSTELSCELVRTRFDYNSETGVVTYSGRERAHLSPSARSRRTGRIAGWPDTHGHLNIKIGKTDYLLHRVIWLHQFGVWPEGFIDHINGNRSDNRLSNLRLVDKFVNAQNINEKSKNSISGLLGVHPVTNSSGWQASIRAKNIQIGLGTFQTKEDAHQAYLLAKSIVHPEASISKGLTIDFSKFNKTSEKNLRKAGYWPGH